MSFYLVCIFFWFVPTEAFFSFPVLSRLDQRKKALNTIRGRSRFYGAEVNTTGVSKYKIKGKKEYFIGPK